MKIVLVTKNPPFYENTLDRKSYIKIHDKNIIDDNIFSMEDVQNEYFSKFFTVNESLISDKFNLNIIDLYTRTTYIEPRNFPLNSYPNTFEFWNNVSYAKLIYDNGFIEYCHISSRRCDNLAINKWYFTFTLDVWNTYWIKVYANIKQLSNFPILISRMHSDRFDYLGSKKISFKFLSSQDNAFWNKEQFETSISSKIIIKSGITYTPYTEPNNRIINQYDFLNKIYKGYVINPTTNPKYIPFFDISGNGFPLAFINHTKDEVEPWKTLNKIYGAGNAYWLVPGVNVQALNNDYTIRDVDFPFYKNAFESEIIGNTFIWQNNLRSEFIDDPQLASYILTPKPTLRFNSRNFLYNDIAYPIRLRDDYSFNNNQNINNGFFNMQNNFKHPEDTPPNDISGVVIARSLINSPSLPDRVPVTELQPDGLSYLNTDPMNAMCDERISIVNTPLEKLIDFLPSQLLVNVITKNEPKLYDEEIFNIEYSRYGQASILISPKWYFYDETKTFDDIWKWKSIFLLGYQYVQPHICILSTGPISGLYRFINQDGSRNLISQFSGQQQTVTDAEKQFLVSNRSQLNTGLNNQLRSNEQGFVNSLVGGIAGVAGGAIGGFLTGGPAGAAAGIAGGLFAGTMGIANNRIQAQNAQDAYDAKLTDLANTPNSTSDNSSESTYKTMNSVDGIWKLNWINDIDKQKIVAFHQQQGYFLNKFVIIGSTSGEGINSFATRQFYNFWQIPEFKLLIQDSTIAPEYQQYFQNLFSNSGITLWHTTDINGNIYDTVGQYSYENWELSLTEFIGA